MTAKEKANELVESFAETIPPLEFGVLLERNWLIAKQCALIAVAELKKQEELWLEEVGYNSGEGYFTEVEKEIQLL